MRVCVCVWRCVCVGMWMRACVRTLACVRGYVLARVCARVRARVCAPVCVFVCVSTGHPSDIPSKLTFHAPYYHLLSCSLTQTHELSSLELLCKVLNLQTAVGLCCMPSSLRHLSCFILFNDVFLYSCDCLPNIKKVATYPLQDVRMRMQTG